MSATEKQRSNWRTVDVRDTLALLLAGGVGSRLNVLVRRRAKPAVPFGGIYRIVDFTLSNIQKSGIERVGILTQYLPYSLSDHVGRGEAWGLTGRHREARILPPHTGTSHSDWYKGTADAVYRNLSYIRRHNPSLVVIVSGDHIYSMDYTPMLEYHLDRGAAATLAIQKFPLEECSSFGTVLLNDDMSVRGFDEKPAVPRSPWISLGIYVFRRDILEARLEEVTGAGGGVDFARHIFANMLERGDRLIAYPFQDYWQDVGTLQAYFDAHMDLISDRPRIDLAKWGVRTNLEAKRYGDRGPAYCASTADIHRVRIGRGSRIYGQVESSVLSSGVVIEDGAEVKECVIFHDTRIGQGAKLHRVIIDKNVTVGRRAQIGCDIGRDQSNVKYPDQLNSGLTVIGKGAVIPPEMSIGKNVCIGPEMDLTSLDRETLENGETIEEKEG
ncbi:MAG: glucose-1-phosphate adenylyltransferase [Candidatus Eisenbacteria bacterium]|uniref:Glucose-1-phosphate adenylyltransferase n=1 Tax=Eiseniibacteriota bacterium TaxID=2212470 RepID=A0A948RX88_UNCEI|nr:glucose-1-phosphate adenylyltransferase [Candidatus Eisenbacteria bacterium]MBU1950484.1 glucose-1-phosphate adenylyltransferase [Candidatus Eisenbacteria bacterium]MBU2692535.1 glucose-1-phosphate adenylyltransferase [Candidatus Eisenbacteria bacterium]